VATILVNDKKCGERDVNWYEVDLHSWLLVLLPDVKVYLAREASFEREGKIGYCHSRTVLYGR
jgi:hypothetical protein